MQSFAELPEGDLNIEGVARNANEWFFFNRGNGAKGKNIVFTVQGKNLTEEFNIIANEYKLPKNKRHSRQFYGCGFTWRHPLFPGYGRKHEFHV